MNAILVKIFATALTLSQVTTQPDAIRTEFDRERDQGRVVQLLRDGCAHMRKAFDIEDINLDELITTAMEDPGAVAGDTKVLQGLNLADLNVAYRQFCKNENVSQSPVELGAVIDYYNKAVADLPDHSKLKDLQLPGVSTILDRKGERFSEIYEPDHRRKWVPLADIPKTVQQAFIAAEDKRFHEHRGIDERGVIRAFMGNLAKPGRPQGGSTITQQVAKNLLVGDDVTYDRKMREMIVASRIERTLTKAQILEIYLNSIYLGRAAWGVELAAQGYFGKPAKALNVGEAALLAGMAKGPNYYDPEKHPDRARERLAYVLTRMQEDGAIGAGEVKQALAQPARLGAFQRPSRDAGIHFLDHLNREAKALAGIEGLTASSYTVRSTIDPALQLATEVALQEGLARYELNTGRVQFAGPEANLAEAIRRIEAAPPAPNAPPPWRRALEQTRLPLYDVHWPAAVVLQAGRAKGGGDLVRVGLRDGRIVPLAGGGRIRASLKLHDVVFVRVVEGKGKTAARAELRTRPSVQGATLVLENRTGRILSMAGGFSYPLSQLNRATQAHRQPGSAIKPLAYLAALGSGLQPNTLILDSPITLPPVGASASSKAKDYWTPKNFDGRASGLTTLRRALENSKNLVTARLLEGGIAKRPEQSLARVCELALEAQIYVECVRHYPFVLGAQPARLIDLAAFYAAIANEGRRPSPYALESVEQGGRSLYRRAEKPPVALGSADRAAFYQLKTILQGVLERGTARPLRHLAPYVAGKTGTSDDENDAWFVGFTNDVTVALWVGYDNADGKRRTLGRGQTGGKVAAPMLEPILRAAWAHHAPKIALAPPSAEARTQLAAVPIDLATGDRLSGGGGFVEHLRRDRSGYVADTQYRLVSREQAYAFRHPDPWAGEDESADGYSEDRADTGPYAQAPFWDERPSRAPYGSGYDLYGRGTDREPLYDDERPRRRSRRVDPDYPWGNERIY